MSVDCMIITKKRVAHTHLDGLGPCVSWWMTSIVMRDFSSRRTAHWYSTFCCSTIIRNRWFPGLDDTREPRPQIISIGWGKVLAIRWWSKVRGRMLLWCSGHESTCCGSTVEGERWTSDGVHMLWSSYLYFTGSVVSIEQWDSDEMEGCRWGSTENRLLSIVSVRITSPSP